MPDAATRSSHDLLQTWVCNGSFGLVFGTDAHTHTGTYSIDTTTTPSRLAMDVGYDSDDSKTHIFTIKFQHYFILSIIKAWHHTS